MLKSSIITTGVAGVTSAQVVSDFPTYDEVSAIVKTAIQIIIGILTIWQIIRVKKNQPPVQ